MKIINTTDTFSGRRLRVRAVNEDSVAALAAELAAKRGEPAIVVRHGGDVANRYGYPAATEGVVAVALSPYLVVVAGCRLPANKVTYAGVLAACVGQLARPLLDNRFGDAATVAARKAIIEWAKSNSEEASC